jgi:hypothetical protein
VNSALQPQATGALPHVTKSAQSTSPEHPTPLITQRSSARGALQPRATGALPHVTKSAQSASPEHPTPLIVRRPNSFEHCICANLAQLDSKVIFFKICFCRIKVRRRYIFLNTFLIWMNLSSSFFLQMFVIL